MNALSQRRVKALFGINTSEEFVDLCNWADVYARAGGHRDTLTWHFVNVPPGATSVDLERDCKKPNSCVVAEIVDHSKLFRSAPAPETKAMALKFVMHFVGDVHQPLHVTTANGDRGGNEIEGMFRGQKGNLHQIWDTGLILADGRDWRTIASDLAAKITPKDRSEWNTSLPIDWANESLAISSNPSTGYVGRKNGFLYGELEITLQTPILFKQITKAGVRLANRLEDLLISVSDQELVSPSPELAEAGRLFQAGRDAYTPDPEAAEDAFAKSLELRRSVLPPTDKSIADVHHWLGAIQLNRKKYELSEQNFREAIKIYDMTPSTDGRELVSAINGFTSALGNQKKNREAILYARRGIAIQKSMLGERFTGRSYRTLGLLYLGSGRTFKAYQAFKDFRAIIRSREPIDEEQEDNATYLLSEANKQYAFKLNKRQRHSIPKASVLQILAGIISVMISGLGFNFHTLQMRKHC